MLSQSDILKFYEKDFYLRYWAELLSEEVSKKEADQVLNLLKAESGHILDWCGGWGRHSLWFAEKGFEITILDMLGKFLEIARQKFKEKGKKVKTIEADCKNTPKDIQADYAVCLMNSIGFMNIDDEIKAFKSLHSSLKEGAKFLVDCTSLLYIAKVFQPHFETKDKQGNIYYSDGTFDFETNILHKVFNIKSPNGHIESREISQRLYTPRDLEIMLTQAGFIIDELYGDWDGNPISFSSEKIIMIAHK